MGLQHIRQKYEGRAADEWNRLNSSAFSRIERLITNHYLDRYLPPGGFILDAGSGPGTYAIPLAQQGYHVAMLDVVGEMLRLGRRKALDAGISNQVMSQVVGDIAALPYALETFDALICLGAPLSHLLESEIRLKAVTEMVRVLKPGGCLFVTCLSRISLYRAMAYWMNESLIDQCKTGEIQQSGVFQGWITGYAFQPGELVDLLKGAGVGILEEVGCESLAAHLPADHLSQIEADPALWPVWKEILLSTCNEPSVVGISSHLMVIGKKEF